MLGSQRERFKYILILRANMVEELVFEEEYEEDLGDYDLEQYDEDKEEE